MLMWIFIDGILIIVENKAKLFFVLYISFFIKENCVFTTCSSGIFVMKDKEKLSVKLHSWVFLYLNRESRAEKLVGVKHKLPASLPPDVSTSCRL